MLCIRISFYVGLGTWKALCISGYLPQEGYFKYELSENVEPSGISRQSRRLKQPYISVLITITRTVFEESHQNQRGRERQRDRQRDRDRETERERER